jgi:hypothetical protein
MDTLRCPTCTSRLDPALLWSAEDVRCPYCDAEIAVPDVLASAVGADDGAQLSAFPELTRGPRPARPAEPHDDGFPDDATAEEVERALANAVAALEAEIGENADVAGLPLPSEAMTDDLRRLLARLGVEAPGPDAPIDEIEHALAEARAALERIEREIEAHKTEELVAVVADLDPHALLDDDVTDPSVYLDEWLPTKEEK